MTEPADTAWPYGSGTPDDPYTVPPGWSLEMTEEQAKELYQEQAKAAPDARR